MILMRNIKEGEPKTLQQITLAKQIKARFFFDDEGRDWYECQKLFSENTLKVAFDENNVICCIQNDVSLIYPENLSVAEVANTTANRRADTSGEWVYLDGAIVKREKTKDELIWLAEQKKNSLLEKISAQIAPLQDAVELGIATTDEESQLSELKQKRVFLSRINTSEPASINWPED